MDFILGPGDRVGVQVFKRADLSGEFRVSPSGELSLPFLRGVPVTGLTLGQAQAALIESLRGDAFLLDPRVSLELVEGQPVFVAGDVGRPGAYPFTLGMTVQRAIAAAGGPRSMAVDDVGARLAISQLRERMRLAQQTIGLAIVRRARLTAEREERDDFATPEEAARFLAAEKMSEAADSERRLLRQRNGAFHSQVEISNAELAGFHDEIEALKTQSAAKQHESDLALQESRYVDDLQRKGLTPRSSRVNELQRLAVQLDGEQSQIGAAMSRAREEIARIGQTISSVTNQRQVDLSTAVKEADDAISAAELSLDESRSVLGQTRLPLKGGGTAAFAVERQRGEPVGRSAAQAETPLLPGDLVIVSGGETL